MKRPSFTENKSGHINFNTKLKLYIAVTKSVPEITYILHSYLTA